MLIASNSKITSTKVKNTQKTHKCSKKEKITVIQPEDFNKLKTGSFLQNGYSEKFEKFFRKTSVVIYSF